MTLIVLCNIATVHVIKMTHLSATVLPRCHIFRQDGHLLSVVILSLSVCCHVTLIVLCNVATIHVVKMTHLSATVRPRCHIFRQDCHLLIECHYILSLSVCCHVTLIVLCNIATIHVVKMTHLSATVLPRCHIFRQDGHLLIECRYILSLSVCCHVTLIVSCNIVTVYVVKMTHLSATVLPRCHIFR